MCIFAVLLVNKYLSSSELELILINIKRNNNYYYTIKTSFIHIYDTGDDTEYVSYSLCIKETYLTPSFFLMCSGQRDNNELNQSAESIHKISSEETT